MRKAVVVAVAIVIAGASMGSIDFQPLRPVQADAMAANSNPVSGFFRAIWQLEKRKNAWLRRVFRIG